MEDKVLVSVIVPVYNVEKYLNRCVDSLVQQTYHNLEIIMVDDGSKDSSGSICDLLAKQDKRIKVIHKVNGGLASARNEGIKKAIGEYILFVDSDDWIELDTIEYCINLSKKYSYNADIIQYNVIEINSQDTKVKNSKEIIKILNNKDIINFLMKESTKTDTYFSACRCMYKTSIIKNILFEEGKINEDIPWKYRVLNSSKSMIDSNQIKYYYFQSVGSITTEGLKEKDFDLYHAANELLQLTCNENYGSIKKLAIVKSARTPLSLLCKIAYYGIKDSTINENEIINKLVSELKHNLKTLILSPIPLSRKVIAIMMSINFNFTKKSIRFVKKIWLEV